MPVFEFRCTQCGTIFATLVGMTLDSTVACPSCSSSSVHKLVSRVAKYRNEDQRIDEMTNRLDEIGEPESVDQARQLVREMGRAMDDDMSEEMEQMFDADVDDLGG